MFFRLGLAMARLRWVVLGVWAVVVLVALPFAPRAAAALSPGGFTSSSMQSQQAVDALQAGLHTSFTSVLVIFSSKTLTADDPRFADEATGAVASLRQWPKVEAIIPFTLDAGAISHDRHAAYTVVLLHADADAAPAALPALNARLSRQPDLQLTAGGCQLFYAD